MFTKILRIFRFIFEVIQVGLPFNVHFSGGSFELVYNITLSFYQF